MLHQNKNINFVTCNIQPPKYGFPSPGTFGANDIRRYVHNHNCIKKVVHVVQK